MKVLWGVGMIGLVAGCGAAVAQTAYPERRFDITLSGRTTYDSNVVRRVLPTASDLRAEDIRFTPQAQLDIVYPFSRQSLFLNGVIGYDFYARNTQLNRERLNLAAGADLRFAVSCGARLSGEYVRRQSDLADLFGAAALNGTDRLVNTEEIRAFDAQLNCGDAYGLQPGLGYRHEVADNSAEFQERNNYTSDSFNAQLGYVRPSFGALSIFSTYRTTRFPNRMLEPATAKDEVDFYTIGGRYERQIGSRLRGSVSLGYTKVDPTLSSVPSFSGVSYSADLTYQPTERLRLDLGASREAQVSNLLDVDYSVDTNYRLDAEYAFSRRLRLLFGTSFTDRDLEASSRSPARLAPSSDKTYIGYVGTRYDLNPRMSFDLMFTQQRRDADISIFDYKSTQVAAGVSLKL